MASTPSEHLHIFISYSHKDAEHLERLKTHLTPYFTDGDLEYGLWDDTKIQTGTKWTSDIEQALQLADVAILLISADFLASRFIRENELPPLLEAAEKKGIKIIPVILSPSGFENNAKLAQFQAANSPSEPLSSMEGFHNKEDWWARVAKNIYQSVLAQKAQRSSSTSADVDSHPSTSHKWPSTDEASQLASDTPLQATAPPLVEQFHPDSETTSPTNNIEERSSSTNILTSELHMGWEDVSRNEPFYGREIELLTLKQWILDDQCRVIAILGMGGMGKTSISVALVDQVLSSFSYVFWCSLRNAPPFKDFMQYCVQYVSDRQRISLPESVNDQIRLLLEYMRINRCLIVLDNMETILQAAERAGEYRKGYEAYGRLLEIIGKEKHQSCLLLTSREKPKEIAYLEGEKSPVRSYPLKGLKSIDGQKILQEKGLHGAKNSRESLIRRYVGNPLALKLVSQLISEVFEGDTASFLKEGEAIFGDIRDVLDQQFERLSELERELMYWLAIEREAASLDTLQNDVIGPVTRREIQEVLRSLLRRNLIEAASNIFLLQNVVLEYVMDRFVDSIAEEISSEKIKLFDRHALIKAEAKDYIRESQVRLILTPLVQRLLASLGVDSIELKCQSILALLRKDATQQLGYAAGNVLNMLLMQGYNLRGYDFAHLTIRQAYLRGQKLPEVIFAHAHFIHSVFTDIFSSVLTIAFSPDGEFLAIGTTNGEVKLWNVSEGIPVLVCLGHTGWIKSLAFSPDGRLLASGSNDHTVRLWEVSSGQCLNVLNVLGVALLLQEQSSSLSSIAFSCDGMTLAIGINDRVWLWDVNTANRIRTLRDHAALVQSVAFSADGRLLASGSEDHTIRLWEVSTGQCLKVLEGHTASVRSVAFSADGRLLASGSEDHPVWLWEVGTGQSLKVLQGHTDWVLAVAFSPDGQLLATGSDDKSVKFWEIGSGQCIATLRGYSNRVFAVAFDPAGHFIVSGSEDFIMRFWDVSSGQCLREFKPHNTWVYSVAFSPDGRLLATGSEDRTIRLWEVGTGQFLNVLQGHANWVQSVAFSPDGRLLASGSEDHTIRLWEVSTGQCLKVLEGHAASVRSVAFSPDGRLLASGSNDHTIRLWEVSTGQSLNVLQGHAAWVRSVAFSPDGRLLASGSDDRSLRLWEVSTGQCLNILQRGMVLTYPVAFCPDGQILANGSNDQTIQLWDINKGLLLRTLQGHSGNISSIAFSSDGSFLLSGSDDETVKLWNVGTGTCLLTLRSDRPYEQMDITDVTGLTKTQREALKILGAIEKDG
jgi:WD40 repeat protein